jgi:hypothetical protein
LRSSLRVWQAGYPARSQAAEAWSATCLVKVQKETEELNNPWAHERWNDSGKGRVLFEDDPNAIVGNRCLRLTPQPYA